MNTWKHFLIAASVALASLVPHAAVAGMVTGKELLGICHPVPVDPVFRLKVAECRGYVVAIADSSSCNRKNLEFKWNSASNPSQGELVNKVVDWLSTHPATLGYQADGLVAAALSDAYPCDQVTAAQGDN